VGMLALAAATSLRPENSFALVTSRSGYPAPFLNPAPMVLAQFRCR
jgi:hypothetical protein